MVIGTQVISFDDKLFQLIRTFKEREGFPVDDMKMLTNSNIALRRDGILYFCRLIEEAQVILEDEHTETSNTEEKPSIEGEVLSTPTD